MSGEVVWLPGAAKDVQRLRDFIRSKNPEAAKRAASRIKGGALLLRDTPYAGKPVEDTPPFHDLIIPFGNGEYIMRYRLENNRILIVRVRHSKEEGFTSGE